MTSFVFRDRSSTLASAIEVERHVGYVIDDGRICHLAGALRSTGADLITIALSCYTVDRLQARGAPWSRELHLEIPVRDVPFWATRAKLLETFLHRLTDDRWVLTFVSGRRWRSAEQQMALLGSAVSSDASVGLFSGGLDSLAGAARFLASSTSPLVLLGVRSSYLIGSDQRLLARRLRDLWPERVHFLRVPLRLQRAGDGEQTQRVRAFVYLTLGAIVATTAGIQSLVVFENGVGAFNPRVAEFQVGSQANRSTHPTTLRGFSDLMHELDMPVDVLLPHRLETKGEHIARMPEAARPLISLTASCDSYPLRRPGATHCGTRCGSCILRRQALLSAGLADFDRRDYVELPFEPGAPTDTYRLAAWQAWQFTMMNPGDSDTIRRRWPSLADVPTGDHGAIVDLFQRYGGEWASILGRRPQLARDCGWPIGAAA